MLIPVLFIASFTFAPACNENKSTDSTEVAENMNEKKFEDEKMEDDREFAIKAASGGLMEVELGNLAATNAASEEVKNFGNQMVTDHSKANEELKTIAAAKNISLPGAPGEDQMKHINDLKEKKGADFDKAYIDFMVDDHKEDVELYEKEANNGKDAEIKSFASGVLPTLKHHHEMAQGIKDKMK